MGLLTFNISVYEKKKHGQKLICTLQKEKICIIGGKAMQHAYNYDSCEPMDGQIKHIKGRQITKIFKVYE